MRERLYSLIIKLLGIKGLIWITGSVFLFLEKIDSFEWLILSIGVGGLNVAQKGLLGKKK